MNSVLNFLKRRWQIVLGICIAAGLGFLFVFNPANHAIYPQCAFRRMTGWNCPGCGGLRAVHQLLHGHFAVAFQLNPLFVVAIPATIIFLARLQIRKSSDKRYSFQPIWLWVGLIVVLGFGVVRNLPFGPFAWMTQLPR